MAIRSKHQKDNYINQKIKLALSYKQAYDKIWKVMYNLPYLPLEKPIHIGYDVHLHLRDDVARSQRGQELRKIWHMFHTPKFIKFDIWESLKNKNWNILDASLIVQEYYPNYFSKNQSYLTLHLNDIKKSDYDKLTPQQKKLFYSQKGRYCNNIRNTERNFYFPSIRTYELVVEVKKHYMTEIRVMDEVLQQQYDFYYDKLFGIENYAKYLPTYGRYSSIDYRTASTPYFYVSINGSNKIVWSRPLFKEATEIIIEEENECMNSTFIEDIFDNHSVLLTEMHSRLQHVKRISLKDSDSLETFIDNHRKRIEEENTILEELEYEYQYLLNQNNNIKAITLEEVIEK